MVTSTSELMSKFDRSDPFRGVFASDDLPKRSLQPGEAIIFNLDKSSGPGTHWTCAINKNGRIIYIDPLGVDAPKSIARYLKNYVYNDTMYQPLRSQSCGKYCIYFIENFYKKKPFHKGLDAFPSKKNDTIVTKFFSSI